MTGRHTLALLVCVFLSGGSGLIYEVLWVRRFGLVMGQTVYALSAVLTVFLGGLAFGAWFAGRRASRQSPTFSTYVGLELGIAACGMTLPFAIAATEGLFGGVYRAVGEELLYYSLAQFGLCALLIGLPTFLMGATLPVLCAVVFPTPERTMVGAAWVYGANTVGAAAGVAVAGWVLLPALGMATTNLVAVGLNLLVAAAAYGIGRGAMPTVDVPAANPGVPDPPTPDLPGPGALTVIYGLSGLATITLQVAWARLVGLSIGSTHHGFTVTLFSFVAGLGLGSLLVPLVARWIRRIDRALFWLAAAIAVTSAASIPYLGSLPAQVVQLSGPGESRRVWELLLVWGSIIVPTLAMGMLLPCVTRALAGRGAPAGALGRAYAANTIGGIVGSFLAGFVLLPTIGMRATIIASSVVSFGVALGFLAPRLRRWETDALLASGLVGAVLGAILLLSPRWDRELITCGPYVYGSRLGGLDGGAPGVSDIVTGIQRMFGPVIDYREGPTTVTTIRRRGDLVSLQTAGKTDATNNSPVQEHLAHVPLIVHGAPRDVLIIGLGGGATLASTLMHPVRSVECVEIAPTVVELARKYFPQYLATAESDPRLELHIGDGRNHLIHGGRQYDVIISQPSSPWISGSASLFTVDFFRRMREALREHGVACSWFSATDATGEVMRSAIGSWQSVFPHSYLMETQAFGSYLLLGLADDRVLDSAISRPEFEVPAVTEALERTGIASLPDLFGMVLLGPEAMRAASSGVPLNTDDRGFIEFAAAWSYEPDRMLEVEAELRYAQFERPLDLRLSDLTPEERARHAVLTERRIWVLEAEMLELRGQRGPEWQSFVQRIREVQPRHPYLQR